MEMQILTGSHGFLEGRDQNSLQAQADQSHDATEFTDKLGLHSLGDSLRNTLLLVFANKQDRSWNIRAFTPREYYF